MASIFSQPQTIQGGFRADQLSVSLGSFAIGLIITRIGISFEQPLNMIYALEGNGSPITGAVGGVNNTGGNYVYMVAGRPRGTASIERIIGPNAIGSAWLTQYGNACNVTQNTLNFAAASGNCVVGGATSSTGQYTLSGVVISRFGLNVASEQAMIQNALEMSYADLQIPTTAA